MVNSTGSPAGRGADWDAARYDASFSFVPQFGRDVLELLAPRPGERILDIGCGTGHLTAEIAARGASVVGVDLSPAMVDQAHRQYPELDLRVMDAAQLPFAAEFDAIFSNATLHWVPRADHPRVAAGIQRALRPGGRFATEFGGTRNIQAVVAGLEAAFAATGTVPPNDPNPWYYPGIAEYAGLLEAAGLEVVQAWLFARPTPLEPAADAMRNWIEMFAPGYLAHVAGPTREALLREVEDQLRPALYHDGRWHVDYRRLRMVALKPEP